jgi:Secretion system C-terminal sorting domain
MKKTLLLSSCLSFILGLPVLKAQTPCQLLTTVTPNTSICAGTPVTLAVSPSGANLGTGVDGVLTVNTTLFTDNVKSAVVGTNNSGINKVRVASATGYAVGNEVLIITMQDANIVGNLVGKYEYRTISSISLDTLRFSQAISNSYVATGTLKHQVIKVPQYTNVNVTSGGVLTCSAWNGTVGGVLCFKATGLVTINAGGSINATGKGYRGVAQKAALWRNADGGQGEGIYGTGIASGANNGSSGNNSGAWLNANGNGGGGGTGTGDSGGGGGGGYATTGTAGVNWGHTPGVGGNAVGNSSVTLLIMGGAGGEGGADEDGAYSGAGGNGGGIVSITSNSIVVTGNISSNGNIGNGASNGAPGGGCGTTAGGGGAGGSINLILNSFSGAGANITVSGGTGGLSTGGCNSGIATGGTGSNGRIRLDMPGTLPVTTPAAFQGTNTLASGVTYLWSNGANTFSTVVTPSVTTNYTITITTTSGCTGASSVVAVNVNPLPTVVVNSGAICSGSSFTMSASGASTYTYSSGSAIVAPTSNAVYTVTGTSALGCTNTALSNVTVNALPVISVNSGAICTGKSFTMSPSGASTYTFSSGSAVVSPVSNTSYNVTGTGANGCVSAIAAVSNVTVNALPTISVNSGAICSGKSFTMSPSGASTYSYSGGLQVVSPVANSVYTVTGTSALGCTNTALSSVTVNALPTVLVNSGAICLGNSFTMIPSGASTYVYSSGSPIVSPTSNTSYNVVGTSALGCTNTAISSVTVNSLPVITVNSGAICLGNSFTMIPGGATTYTFSSGSAVVSPITNSSYNVTGTNANGCVSASAAVSNVTVNALPVLSVNSGAICAGDSFTMSPSGATTYTFSSGSPVVTPATNSSYNVTGTDVNGCVSAVAAVSNVTVNALPTISVNSGAICAGDSFTMTPSGAVTYSYSSGSDVVTPAANASYIVTGVSAEGCTNTAVSNVTVNALPIISVNSGAICAGDSYTMNPSGASTYTFSNGNAVVTPSANTSYTVFGTDVNGCVSNVAAVSSVTVNTLPSITVNSGIICAGDSFTMNPSGATTYTFSSGSPVVSPIANTSYSVSGTDLNGCVSSIFAVSDVTVNALPTLVATSDNTLLCSGQTAILTVIGATSYTWNTSAVSNSISVTPSVTTVYSVNGTDTNGCVNSINISQAVTLCTGVENVSATEVSLINLYPNPNNGSFNMDLNEASQIIIINAVGQVIFNETLNAGKQNLDILNAANGIYFVKVKQGNKHQTIKFIKD